MKSWKELIIPRDDILSSSFDEAMFTAALDDVIEKREKNPIYSKGALFFDNTHITKGLHKLIYQVFATLKGQKAGNNVIELRTTFGGGKTHSLISLYHLCRDLKLFKTHKSLEDLNKELNFPENIEIKIAALVGSSENVSKVKSVNVKGEKLEILTWCGDLAYQLGGLKAFKIISVNDKDKSAPGKNTLHELFDSIKVPCLILMDEVVSYLVSLGGVDKHLYDETLQFIQQLVEVVAKREDCAFVFSLPETIHECINEDGVKARKSIEESAILSEETYAKAKKVTQRIKTALDPVEYIEIFDIIRKRLFKSVESTKFEEIRLNIQEIWNTYKTWGIKFLPEEIFRSVGIDLNLEEKLEKSYPFHPALIDVFYKEWGTHSQFQRTRAMLRIFSKLLNHFWSSSETQGIIMPSDLPFEENNEIKTELLTYMGPNFENVITTDIKRCKNLELRDAGDYSKWHVYSRLFRSIFLHSLPVGGVSPGVLERDILLDCVSPGMTPVTFKDALRELKDNLFHLFQEGNKYVIKFDINLNAMIVDECERVKAKDVDEFLFKKMDIILPKSHPAIKWPETSNKVPEKLPKMTHTSLIFVICSPNLMASKLSIEDKTSNKLQEFATMRGATPRVNKNGLFFILMDQGQIGDLKNKITRYLAMEQILSGVEAEDYQFQQLSEKQIIDLIKSMYELNPNPDLRNKAKLYDIKAKLSKKQEETIDAKLSDSYNYVVHWTGKAFEQFEIISEKKSLVERALDFLIEKGIIMDKIGAGYISKQIQEIKSTEQFWNSLFQISGETIPLNIKTVQDALSKAIEEKKLAYAIFSKGKPIAKDLKPDDFPTWVYGKYLDSKNIKISSNTWILPSTEADIIIKNGETPPDPPILEDIPELKPFEKIVKITWNYIDNAKHYALYREINPIKHLKNKTAIYEGKSNYYNVILQEAGMYYFNVVAINDYGISTLSQPKSVVYNTKFPPLTPNLLPIVEEPVNEPSILIKWEKSKGASFYHLFQSTKFISISNNGVKIYEGEEIEFKITLSEFGNYYFAVIASNDYGNSKISNCEGVTYGKKTPPKTSFLTLNYIEDENAVEISWESISDATNYKLYRDTEIFEKFSKRLTKIIEGNIVGYKDLPGTSGMFYYCIVTENEYGESVFSNCESILVGGEDNPIILKLDIQLDYLSDFIDNIGEFTGNLISIGAEPKSTLSILANIPKSIPQMAQNALKKKLEEIIKKSKGISNIEINWKMD